MIVKHDCDETWDNSVHHARIDSTCEALCWVVFDKLVLFLVLSLWNDNCDVKVEMDDNEDDPYIQPSLLPPSSLFL